MNCILGLILVVSVSVAKAASTPVFASEYALNYTITNYAYDFVVIGQWTVDHAKRRERQDSGNSTLQPAIEVKDFFEDNMGKLASWVYNSSEKKCCKDNATGTQPRWEVDSSGLKVSETDTEQVWRTYDAADALCVDFHIPVNDGTLAQLPSLLNWWGNCNSNDTPDPTTETLVQVNDYPQESWSLKTPSGDLFAPASTCHECMTLDGGENNKVKKNVDLSLQGWKEPSLPHAAILDGSAR